ncbi:hypothetical protein BKA70DRAFT_1240795 [Coprinopsis sp. MPI-PUGE-AT-0042]|nr:hypothetical protein BKA70DRAFT_1240795 [Coprinopsis sp. MPI-PUGE-AT-0042]
MAMRVIHVSLQRASAHLADFNIEITATNPCFSMSPSFWTLGMSLDSTISSSSHLMQGNQAILLLPRQQVVLSMGSLPYPPFPFPFRCERHAIVTWWRSELMLSVLMSPGFPLAKVTINGNTLKTCFFFRMLRVPSYRVLLPTLPVPGTKASIGTWTVDPPQ